jgi:predicted esterase
MTPKIQVTKTAKVATFGNPDNAKIGLLALHGYGQLSQFFIRKFHALAANELFVVVPEGLHRFYLNGTQGRVGASWMTKEERQDDILDNMTYLDLVYQNFFASHSINRFAVLGFSQGASTAARWIDHTQHPIHAFIQWAGIFPPDLDLKLGYQAFSKLRHFYVVGNEDPYFLEAEYVNSQAKWLQSNGLNPKFLKFQGGHSIDCTCLQAILDELL